MGGILWSGVVNFWHVGRLFFGIAPLRTTLIVIMGVVSQVALLVASFLPLKVIFLMGGGSINVDFLQGENAVVVLSAAAVMLFCLHVVFDVISIAMSLRIVGANSPEEHGSKGVEAVVGGYSRYSRGVSSQFFVLVSLVGLYCINTLLFCFFWLFLLFAIICTYGVISHSSWVAARWNRSFSKMIRSIGAGGALLGFIVVIFEHYSGVQLSVMTMVFSLLLLRQLFRHQAEMVVSMVALMRHRESFTKLFEREK